MRYLLFCFMASTAMLVWACGADPAANDGDGGGGSGGSACPPDPNTAGLCNSAVQCVVPEGTCSCDTDAGTPAFLCPGGEPPGPNDPRGLPAEQPKTGDCCVTEGMTCGGWDICAPICHCHDGKWSCKDPACPLFFCPDPVDKLSGKFCDDRIGDSCLGDVMGCSEACVCQLDYGQARGVWQCFGPECAFDGGFADAAPPPPFDGAPPPDDGGGPFDGGSVGDGG